MTESKYLENYKLLTKWMLSDLEKVLFRSKANFLCAQSLFNYIEVMGSFIAPYSGCKARFNQFFVTLGKDYQELVNKHNVYEEIRCGLTHEYLPSKRKFSIANPDKKVSYAEIRRLNQCGVKYNKNSGWEIKNGRLYVDFRGAVQRYSRKINSAKHPELKIWFLERCNNINFESIQ